ncbi:hypothetical protein [Pseudomarimonas salicorniae]|uniref:YCII-related domain-containing protein n=1 Tax=Pseudomarimonas salicorniae TaxID=2933270 RepID=A0ABT0GJD7_9GAMM|nr:hypothetical protein [Lysobacter sp. CAU 1642]MCK7594661.1 hypothetical protein [Lysobacter sp. CAU 1642]
MNDYVLLMYDDVTDQAASEDSDAWARYLSALRGSGCFEGGSSIGRGLSFKRGRPTQAASVNISGFIRVRAETLEAAARWVEGNPVHDAGGTVEVRDLPRD